MKTHTVLTITAGGHPMVETGCYDCTTHRWVATSTRPATDADFPYPLKPSIISLRKDITPEPEDEEVYFE